MNLENSTKAWYMSEYYDDDFAEETLDRKATFKGLCEVLERGEDVYQYLFTDGDVDSLIRERMFSKLAKIKGVDYDVIYQQWLLAE